MDSVYYQQIPVWSDSVMGTWSHLCWTVRNVLGYVYWPDALRMALCWLWLQEDRSYLTRCNICWYKVNLSKEFELIQINGEFTGATLCIMQLCFSFSWPRTKSLKLDLLCCWTVASLIYYVCIELQQTTYSACTKLCNISLSSRYFSKEVIMELK